MQTLITSFASCQTPHCCSLSPRATDMRSTTECKLRPCQAECPWGTQQVPNSRRLHGQTQQSPKKFKRSDSHMSSTRKRDQVASKMVAPNQPVLPGNKLPPSGHHLPALTDIWSQSEAPCQLSYSFLSRVSAQSKEFGMLCERCARCASKTLTTITPRPWPPPPRARP